MGKDRKRQFGEIREWAIRMPCCTCFRHPGETGSQPSHAKSRGAGGGADDIGPQCMWCHQLFHTLGRHTAAEIWGFSLQEAVARFQIWWRMLNEEATPTALSREVRIVHAGGHLQLECGHIVMISSESLPKKYRNYRTTRWVMGPEPKTIECQECLSAFQDALQAAQRGYA